MRIPRSVTTLALTGMSTLLLPATMRAADFYWDRGNATSTWTDLANWDAAADGTGGNPASLPGAGDVTVFTTTPISGNATTVNMSGNYTLLGMRHVNTAATTISTNSATLRQLTLGGGGILIESGAGSATYGNTSTRPVSVALDASQTWTNNGTGTLTLAYSTTTPTRVRLGDSNLTISGSGATTINDPISGNGSLTKNGTGTLILGNNNTHSGGTFVNAGTLSLSSTGSLPDFGTHGSWSVAGGATLMVPNATTDAEIATLRAAENFAAGASLGFDTTAGARTYADDLTDTAQGALGLAKSGTNALTLSGNNTYTGGTLLYGGNLSPATGNAFGTGNITILAGAIASGGASVTIANDVIFNNTAASNTNMLGITHTYTGNICGTGSLQFNGFPAGTIAFTGNNTGWSGNITSTGGSQLRLGHASAIGTGSFSFGTNVTTSLALPSMSSSTDLSGGNGVVNNITINSAGTVFYLDNPLKLSGVISGPGSLRVGTGGTAPLYLTNNNTYTGFTNLQDGILSVSHIGNGGVAGNIGQASSAPSNLVFSNGTLQYTGAGENTDRRFTIGSAAASYTVNSAPAIDLNATVTATIDASGSGPLVFANTGSLTAGNALNNVLKLAGNNTGNNTLAAVIADSTDNSAVVLENCTTTSSGTGAANRQIIMTDTTGILVGDTVSGTGIPANAVVVAVLGPTRLSIEPGATLTQNANATLTFTNPDVSTNKTHLLKSGSGTWVLAGTNTYTGNTTVTAGVLSLSGGNAIPDANTLIIDGGRANLAANETVGVLVLGNATQGNNTYGSTSSSATVKNNTRFSGTGVLTVGDGIPSGSTTLAAWAAGYGVGANLTDNDDGDKFTNGEEYAFDLDPTTAEYGSVLASQTILSNGNITLTLAFNGDSSRSDINYVVRRAGNPSFTGSTVVGFWNGTANWTTSNSTYFAGQTQSGNGSVKAINVNLLLPAATEPRQFLKVEIESLPSVTIFYSHENITTIANRTFSDAQCPSKLLNMSTFGMTANATSLAIGGTLGDYTGVYPPDPATQYQRGISTTIPGCCAVQMTGNMVGGHVHTWSIPGGPFYNYNLANAQVKYRWETSDNIRPWAHNDSVLYMKSNLMVKSSYMEAGGTCGYVYFSILLQDLNGKILWLQPQAYDSRGASQANSTYAGWDAGTNSGYANSGFSLSGRYFSKMDGSSSSTGSTWAAWQLYGVSITKSQLGNAISDLNNQYAAGLSTNPADYRLMLISIQDEIYQASSSSNGRLGFAAQGLTVYEQY